MSVTATNIRSESTKALSNDRGKIAPDLGIRSGTCVAATSTLSLAPTTTNFVADYYQCHATIKSRGRIKRPTRRIERNWIMTFSKTQDIALAAFHFAKDCRPAKVERPSGSAFDGFVFVFDGALTGPSGFLLRRCHLSDGLPQRAESPASSDRGARRSMLKAQRPGPGNKQRKPRG